MFLPHAHHVIWFSATFLLLWSVSLFLRGARTPRKTPPLKSSSIVRLGVILLPFSIALFALGQLVRRWSTPSGVNGEFESGIFEAAAIGVLLFGVTIACIGLFRDSARGRKRCPKCWYDMESLAATGRFVCPECGANTRNERRLSRTRRRWLPVAAAALLVIVASILPGVPNVKDAGAKALVPTTVMIAGMWWWPDGWRGVGPATLCARLQEGKCWEWQRSWVARRASYRLVRVETSGEFMHASAVLNFVRHSKMPAEVWAHVGKLLASPDPTVRAEAAAIASELHNGFSFRSEFHPRAIQLVAAAADQIAPALQQPETNIVFYAAMLLSHAGCHPDAVIAAILKDYPDIDAWIVEQRTPILLRADSQAKPVIDAILGKLACPHPGVRRTVIEVVRDAGEYAVIPAVILDQIESMANHDRDTHVAGTAAKTCVALLSGQPDAMQTQLEWARGTTALRRPAIESLMNDPNPLASEVSALIEAKLRSDDAVSIHAVLSGIRIRAQRGDLNMKKYHQSVREFWKHPDADVRDMAGYARQAIDEIGSTPE